MTATKESTPVAWLKVTWPEMFGGPEAGSVSRQYETSWYNPYNESPCDSPPLYDGHGAGWCGVVLLLQAAAMATPMAPRSQVMHTRARRVMCANYRAPGTASRPAGRCVAVRNRNRRQARARATRTAAPTCPAEASA